MLPETEKLFSTEEKKRLQFLSSPQKRLLLNHRKGRKISDFHKMRAKKLEKIFTDDERLLEDFLERSERKIENIRKQLKTAKQLLG